MLLLYTVFKRFFLLALSGQRGTLRRLCVSGLIWDFIKTVVEAGQKGILHGGLTYPFSDM